MINLIQGGIAVDNRGSIRYVNDFDASAIKRFYIIQNIDTTLVRGWRAHRIEKRWFYVLTGGFHVDVVRMDNWEKPSSISAVERITISADDQRLLYVSEGYATAFQALEKDSTLLVFADYSIDHASEDDYTFPVDYFVNRRC